MTWEDIEKIENLEERMEAAAILGGHEVDAEIMAMKMNIWLNQAAEFAGTGYVPPKPCEDFNEESMERCLLEIKKYKEENGIPMNPKPSKESVWIIPVKIHD